MSFNLSGSVVLDSSVVIKWFRSDEILREQSLRVRQAYLDGRLFIHVPDLLIYEIANVLRFKPDMNENRVQQVLESLFGMRIGIEYISPEVVVRAVEIAYSYNITVYDAVFVALAEQLKAYFITADGKLIRNLCDIPHICHLANIT